MGALLGTFAEILSIEYGVWSYAKPSFLGVPIWLPFMWGLAIVLVTKVSKSASELLKTQ